MEQNGITVESLAVTHRPQSFNEFIGNDEVVDIVLSRLESGRWPAAILISGLYGTGKTTLARLIAKSVNCTNFDAENLAPCGQCSSCTEFGGPTYPAYEEINCGTEGGINDVRRLIKETMFEVPQNVMFNVLDESQQLQEKSINGLLKPAEDGNNSAIWVFVTTNPEKLSKILGSRCLHLKLKPLDAVEIAPRISEITELEGFSIAEEDALAIAENAGGSVREAVRLLEGAIGLADADGRITTERVNEALSSIDLDLEKAVVAFLVMLYNPKGQFDDRKEQMRVALAEIGNDQMSLAANKMEDFNSYVIFFANNMLLGKGNSVKNPNYFNASVGKIQEMLFEAFKGDRKEQVRVVEVAERLAYRITELKMRLYSAEVRNRIACVCGVVLSHLDEIDGGA